VSDSHGYAVFVNDWGVTTEADTYGCCHCQYVVHLQPGSGKRRGYCRLCDKPTCGSEACRECKPFMKQIEEIERRDQLRRAMERA